MTPTRESSWSVEATTRRSTQITSTTAAFSTGSMSRNMGSVRAMVAASAPVGTMVFQGFSLSWSCAV